MLKIIIILLAVSSTLLSACSYNKLKDKQTVAIKKPMVLKAIKMDKKVSHVVKNPEYILFRNRYKKDIHNITS